MLKIRNAALALAALGCVLGVSPAASANAVTAWNTFATQVLGNTVWQAGREQYAMAMVQMAVFDAVNAVHPRYRPWQPGPLAQPGASAVAAVAEAASDVLRALAPDQAGQIGTALQDALAGVDAGARSKGIAAGDEAAGSVLGERRQGGAYFGIATQPGSIGPSAHDPTRSSLLPLLNIDRGPPFVLVNVNQFLPAPPPALDTDQFRRDLEETLTIGAVDSTLRTPDQSRSAQFHVPQGVYPWNEITRQATVTRGLDLTDSARLLALVNVAIADTLSAGTEAKYRYNFWRPDKAAIANSRLGWAPAIGMPSTPEYPCQHCANGSAAQTVLEFVLGDAPMPFTLTSEFSHETRLYRSFRHYAEEEAASRIYGGVHYRWSTIIGSALGVQVANYVDAHCLTPLLASPQN